jgi:hypothetical protein
VRSHFAALRGAATAQLAAIAESQKSKTKLCSNISQKQHKKKVEFIERLCRELRSQ